jgi:chorismate mutase / prephenate dehydratase
MSNTPEKLTLAQLREQIDQTDAALLQALNRRARLAHAVGELKAREDSPVLRPEREAQIITQAIAHSQGDSANLLKADQIEAVWREIISLCRSLERRLNIGYLGPAGTYSEMALLKQFGSQDNPVACLSIDEVFRSVEAGSNDFGVVPVENSTEGSINRTLDLFLQTDLQICAEVAIAVNHQLLGTGSSLQGRSKVVAHPQALAQCQRWLAEHLGQLPTQAVASNAEGARLASNDPSILAIASDRAAAQYGLQTVASCIQDDPSNRTRFAVIGRYRAGASGADQTSVIISVPDRSGAVHQLIEPLARHGVSMKRFESRPARQTGWAYNFYIDVLGHQDDAPVAAALAEMKAQSLFFKVVGSYPRAR